MNEYQNWEHGILEDVSHDTDAIDEYRRVVSETYKKVNAKSETEKVVEKPQVTQIG